jgi:hypothetical protein
MQEVEEQRKKMMVWGKKEKFTPAILFIYRRVRVVGWQCSTTPTVSAVIRHVAARSGVAIPVTVPLGHDGL